MREYEPKPDEIKLSARLKDAVRRLQASGQDPTLIVQAAVGEAVKDKRGKAGGFGSARKHVDQLTQSARLLSEDTTRFTGRRFGEGRKEKRANKRTQHKENRRETRKRKNERKNDFYITS